ncbi:poly-gamma-glutamate hydrolase family protein [Streptomyces sp. URMC 123]|uniref:poly-gamma-glutamate hydrolase family protein n=1 Tax=Streptomyces sp. URMC 123 TaxID=3423403 RepID=UPI003F1BEBB4
MINTNRRAMLAALAGAAVGGPLLQGLSGGATAQAAAPAGTATGAAPAPAAAAGEEYTSNTDLYTRLDDPYVEGRDWGRRWLRHEVRDESLDASGAFPLTAVLAPHGGGIEAGTSELCLAIAGYHPGSLQPRKPGDPLYDYWMFEGLLPKDNGVLHVTSHHCDDPAALAIAGGSRHALSLHGCTPDDVGRAIDPANPRAVVVGGRDERFKALLTQQFRSRGIQAVDGAAVPALNGDHPENIVNRTLSGAGAQLEITTDLRKAMFKDGKFTRKDRPWNTTGDFDAFVEAARAAIVQREQHTARPA